MLGKTVDRFVAVACAVVLAVGLVPVPQARAEAALAPAAVQAAPLEGGDGDVQADYVISTADDFMKFRDAVNSGKTNASTTAALTADISLTFSSSSLPVGTLDTSSDSSSGVMPAAANAFPGTFDGGYHTVTLDIGSMYELGANTQPAAALFGAVGETGVVKNLVVRGSVVSAGSSSASAINGAAAGAVGALFGGTVENVANYASISGGNYAEACNSAGGIVGFGWGTVKNCANHAPVSKQSGWAAGIVGRCATGKATTIENCYNTGAVSYSGFALSSYYYRHAGIACSYSQNGYTSTINLTKCYNAGKVWCSLSGGADQSIAADNALVDKTAGTVSGCFWATDQGSATAGSGITEGMATGMETSAMLDDAFAATLGEPFAASTLAALTPMLSWEGKVWDGRYAITVPEVEGGTVSCSVGGPVSRAKEGDAVAVTAVPADGYELASVSVVDEGGNAVAVSGGTFTMPAAGVTVTGAFSKVDGTKLSFKLSPRDSTQTTWTKDQNLKGKLDLQMQVTDVRKGGYDPAKADIANLAFEWQESADGATFDAIEGAGGSAEWNELEGHEGVKSFSSALQHSVSLAEQGTRYYRLVGTWSLEGCATARVEGPVLTVTVTPAGATEALAEVSSADDLVLLANSVKAGVDYTGKTVTMTGDIDLSGLSSWQPVGTADDPFTGTFDGGGYKVYGFDVVDQADSWAKTRFGLFGYTKGATIRDLTVEGSVQSNAGYVAAVVAAADQSSATTLRNVVNCASVTSTADPASAGSFGVDCAVGGIAGCGAFDVASCANKADVTSNNPFVATAGVVGAMQYASSIANCYNLGTVSNASARSKDSTSSYQLWVAGIACAGISSAGSVTACYNAGAVSAPEGGEAVPEVAAVLAGGANAYASPVATGCYYLEGAAPRGLGETVSGRKGAEQPEAKTAAELKRLYAALGSEWQHGGAANAGFDAEFPPPALAFEGEYGLPTLTVSFDAAGGSAVGPVQVKEGYAVETEPTTAREGYAFSGWYLAGGRVSFPYTPEGDVTLAAKWTPSVTELSAAIDAANAEAAKRGKQYRVVDADDAAQAAALVTKGKHYVTTAQMRALNDAIDAARAVRAAAQAVDTAETAETVAASASAMREATAAFVGLYRNQVGEKVASLSDGSVEVAIEVPAQVYTGEELCPEPVVKVDGDVLAYRADYTLAWRNNTEPGTASVVVTGMGSYCDAAVAEFPIGAASMDGVAVGDVPDARYREGGAVPEVSATFDDGKVALAEGVDYTLELSGNAAVGQASATLKAIEGPGKRFTGSKTVAFNVVKGVNPIAAKASDVSVAYKATVLRTVAGAKVFAVSGAVGKVTFSKASGDARIGVNPDGTVRVQAGTPAGTYAMSARVTAAGDALYEKRSTTAGFKVKVVPVSLAGAEVTLSAAKFSYNKKAQRPAVASVKVGGEVLPASDYAVSYSNPASKDAGSYAVAVTPKGGNCTGSARAAYSIAASLAPKVTAKVTSKKVKASAAKRVSQVIKMGVSSSSKGKVTYKASGASKGVSFKAGKVTLRKGAYKKGTYKISVKALVAAKGNYKAGSKTFTVKFVVK